MRRLVLAMRRLAPACAVAIAVTAWPNAAAAGWGRPTVLSPPSNLGSGGASVAFAPDGAAVVAFQGGLSPPAATYVAVRPPRGPFAAADRLHAAGSVLGGAFAGATPELMIDRNRSSDPQGLCCDYVHVLTLGPSGGIRRSQQLTGDLSADGSTGQLLPTTAGGMLAVVSSTSGLSIAAAPAAGGFGPTHVIERNQLTIDGQVFAGSDSVAFSASTQGRLTALAYDNAEGNRLSLALGSSGALPGHPATLAALPARQDVFPKSVAIHGSSVGVGWLQGPKTGNSEQVELAEASPTGSISRRQSLGAGRAASVTVAGDRRGEEIVVWTTCHHGCPVRAAVRRGGGALSPAATLGEVSLQDVVDGEVPQLAVLPDGTAIVAWVHHGRIQAAELAPGTGRFTRARTISGRGAGNLTLAGGPHGEALAVWMQGKRETVGALFQGG